MGEIHVTVEYTKNQSRTYPGIERGDHVYFKGYYEYRFHKRTRKVDRLIEGHWETIHVFKAYKGHWRG